MGQSFVTHNYGAGVIALTDVEANQVTALPAEACFGWELEEDEHVLITAVDNSALHITHNGDSDAPPIKVVDDDNNEVTILQPGQRYPSVSSHALKGQTSLTITLITDGNADIPNNR